MVINRSNTIFNKPVKVLYYHSLFPVDNKDRWMRRVYARSKKIIVPDVVNVAVGIHKQINTFRPGLLRNFTRPAVYHDTNIIINEHGVGSAEPLVGEIN